MSWLIHIKTCVDEALKSRPIKSFGGFIVKDVYLLLLPVYYKFLWTTLCDFLLPVSDVESLSFCLLFSLATHRCRTTNPTYI